MSKRISIIGSTGSIGTQTLEVIRTCGEFAVTGLAAGKNIDLLERQMREFRPQVVAVWTKEDATTLKEKTKDLGIPVYHGMDGLIQVATHSQGDIVVTAIVGMIGILPTIEAIKAGKTIALANKETLVTAGHLIIPLAKKKNVDIIPVDSEHSAIFQALQGNEGNPIHKIWLTASGGPFLNSTKEELQQVQLKDALCHPNWSMGRKVTVDSSTLANKGLEVMEAKWLFDVKFDQIQVVVQPQSVIHSMVEYQDGSVMAQLGSPDMKVPIAYALSYPKRLSLPTKRLDFCSLHALEFKAPDLERFPALSLAFLAGQRGGSMPTVFNAANEKAVALFLQEKIHYLQIAEIIKACIDKHNVVDNPSVEEILAIEKDVYQWVEERWM